MSGALLLKIASELSCGAGSPTGQCPCGRWLYDETGAHMGPGELDSISARPEAVPVSGSVVSYELPGFGLVFPDCPCNRAQRIADAVWAGSRWIGQYVERRARDGVEANLTKLRDAHDGVEGRRA